MAPNRRHPGSVRGQQMKRQIAHTHTTGPGQDLASAEHPPSVRTAARRPGPPFHKPLPTPKSKHPVLWAT